MGIEISTMGRSGKPGRPFFSLVRAHLLTTCEAGGGIPPFGQAVRSARRVTLSAESVSQCRRCLRASVTIACGAESGLGQNNPDHISTLLKPATGSFTAVMTVDFTDGHFLLQASKETKTLPCGAKKGRDPLWRSTIWKRRS